MFLSTDATLRAVIASGADGFNDDVIAQVLAHQPSAKVQMLRLLATAWQGQSHLFGNFSQRRYSSWNQGYPHSYARRERAREVYKDLLAKDADDECRMNAARAESLLCLSESLPIMGLRPTEKGGIITMTVATNQQTALAAPARINAVRRSIYTQAKALVEDALYEYGYTPQVVHAM